MRVFLRCLIFLTFVLLISASATLRSQTRYYDNWFFGDSVGINFSSGTPRVQRGSIHTLEGSDAISDPTTGELLFYTDGSTVWNRSHEIMSGGTGLKGGASSTQSALIVPSPGNPSHYYIFTADEGEYAKPPNEGIHYSLVDMEREGSLGEVISRNVELLPNASEKLVGVRHCNGRDIWVIAYREWETEYHAWLVTPEGVSDPTITKIPHTSGSSHGSIGSLKASPDGRYLFSIELGFPSVGRLLAFNNRTGEIVRSVAYLPAEYGASFSRSSDYLYTWVRGDNGTSEIRQYPVTSSDSTMIASGLKRIGVSLGSSGWIGTFQLAPDGNIYVAVVTAPLRIGMIESPDAADVRFRDSVILPESGSFVDYSYGLANSIDGYLTTRFAPPLLEREVDTSICIGQSIRLLPSEGSRYRWDSLPGDSCLDCRDPVISPRESGTYGVTISTEGRCAFRETFRVEVIPLPDITITGDTAICSGSTLRLQASGGVRYRWDDAPGLSCTDCPDPEATITGATTYHVTVWNEAGCEARDSVHVSPLPRPTADAGTDTTICVGSSAQLRGSGGERFLWRRADGGPLLSLSCSDCPDPIASPPETTTWVLTVTSATGCSDVDSVTVEVGTESTFSIVGDTVICPATSARITATGAAKFRWDFSPDLSCLDCPDPVVSPSQTTTYYVTGMASDGSCPARDSITITVLDRPRVRAGSDTAICTGGSLTLGADGGVRYRWADSPDLSCLDCPDPVASPSQTTTYYVTGFSAEGCEAQDSVTILVIPPVVDAGRDRTICAGNSAQLGATGGIAWAWEPAVGLDCVDCPRPTASPETTTTYRLTAWGVEGCPAYDSVTVVVNPARELLLQIDRDHMGFNGEPLIIPILLQENLDSSDISRVTLELEYNPEIMLLDQTSVERLLGGTMLEGWDVLIVSHRYGVIELELQAPAGETLSGAGELLRFETRMFLSSARGTELPFRVRATTNCFDFSTTPGYIAMDSLCGMNFRVIEISGAKYRAPTAYPNPATAGQIAFDFGIGLEGATRLELYDQLGNRVARLVDQLLAPGMYRIEWNARGVATGMYHYRLTSGMWSQTGSVRIE